MKLVCQTLLSQAEIFTSPSLYQDKKSRPKVLPNMKNRRFYATFSLKFCRKLQKLSKFIHVNLTQTLQFFKNFTKPSVQIFCLDIIRGWCKLQLDWAKIDKLVPIYLKYPKLEFSAFFHKRSYQSCKFQNAVALNRMEFLSSLK